MLIIENVQVTINKKNINWYKQMGYENIKSGDILTIKNNELIHGSHMEVKVLCDYCLENGAETIVSKKYHVYIKQNHNSIIKKDCCEKCKGKKQIESNQKIYGVNSTSQISEIKEKQIDTCLNNYGVDNPFKSIEIRENIKNTFMDKYGVENPFQSEEIKEKIIKTNLDKYGVKNYTQTEQYKEKKEKTCLERYGVPHPTQNPNVMRKIKETNIKRYGVPSPMHLNKYKEKIKNTNMKRYGVSYYSQTEEFKEKFKQTSLENWGVEHPFQNNEVLDKVKQTCIDRYGVEWAMQNSEIAKKSMNALIKKNGHKISSQQEEIFLLLKKEFENIEINYPYGNCVLDMALFLDDIKIDIEYDGWYWHQDKQRDRRRDEYLKSEGWKVLRIKSGHNIPEIHTILNKINILQNTNRKYTHIILDDWREEGVVNE